jgi:hypothetical protein
MPNNDPNKKPPDVQGAKWVWVSEHTKTIYPKHRTVTVRAHWRLEAKDK